MSGRVEFGLYIFKACYDPDFAVKTIRNMFRIWYSNYLKKRTDPKKKSDISTNWNILTARPFVNFEICGVYGISWCSI